MRNFDCTKYEECLNNYAKKNAKEFHCESCPEMSNFLKPEKKELVISKLEGSESMRQIERETGISKNTVKKIHTVVIAQKTEIGEDLPLCGCGRPAGHRGWCKFLVKKSPSRQTFLKNFGKLTFDDVARKQLEELEGKTEKIKEEINRLMALWVQFNTKKVFLGEYVNILSVDTEPQGDLVKQYKEIHEED